MSLNNVQVAPQRDCVVGLPDLLGDIHIVAINLKICITLHHKENPLYGIIPVYEMHRERHFGGGCPLCA